MEQNENEIILDFKKLGYDVKIKPNNDSNKIVLPQDDRYIQLLNIALLFMKTKKSDSEFSYREKLNRAVNIEYETLNTVRNDKIKIIHKFGGEIILEANIGENVQIKLKTPITSILNSKNPNKLESLDKIKTTADNNRIYTIEKIIYDEDTGFQAIIFRPNGVNYTILAIGGSYSLKEPLLHPIVWAKDWLENNLPIGQNKIYPQLDTLLNVMEKYDKEYNIQEVAGYSLGAILGGSLSLFEKYKDKKYYLYNGGLPTNLIPSIQQEYGETGISSGNKTYKLISPKDANIITMLPNSNEFVSENKELEPGRGGIYHSKYKNRNKYSGHSLYQHFYLNNAAYERKNKTGNEILDELKITPVNASHGAGISVSVPLPNFLKKNQNRNNKSEIKTKNFNSEDEYFDDSEAENQSYKNDDIFAKSYGQDATAESSDFYADDNSNSLSVTEPVASPIFIDNCVKPVACNLQNGCPLKDSHFMEKYCTRKDVQEEISDIIRQTALSLGVNLD